MLLLITCWLQLSAEFVIDTRNAKLFNEKILYNYYEDQVMERLRNMNTIVSLSTDEDVMDQVKRYVLNDRNGSKSILNRGELYFPLIERILFDYDLPFQLRNLAALESALNPKAHSYAGAAGLWQLMPETARNQGLRLNKNIDERLDPVASTKAAAIYLKKLYEMFGDWNLVLASYNCGEYKVKSLLEEHNTKEYSVIKKYLPRQTQLFIPTFLGVSYMLEYYGEHNLIPEESISSQDYITFVKIDKGINLNKLYKETRIEKELFQTLNPALKQNQITANESGYYVGLPDSIMVDFVEYYMNLHKDKVEITNEVETVYGKLITEIISFSRPFQPEPEQVKKQKHDEIQYNSTDYADITEVPETKVDNIKNYQYHVLRSGESIQDVANLYNNLSLDQLMSWNKLVENSDIKAGIFLIVKK